MKLIVATAIVALTLPVLSFADINSTATLTAAMGALNLDAGTTGASGGDLLWNGTTLTLQGSATALTVPGVSGADEYNALTQALLAQFSPLFTSAAIGSSALPVGAIVGVKTNGGHYAKLLVTSNSGGSLVVQYTTYGATGSGGGGGGGGPSITDVQNAASNLPSVLPNGAIAQGALFVVKGANLGPATFIQQTSFPFTTSIGGTSITVTVNGTTVNVIMFYSLAAQVAGILPSKTPTGTGTLKLTYNGQSATAPITVVQNNIGIYTVSTSGTGDAIAFLNSDSQLITPTHAANPGDVIAIWGTGLGPVNLDETMAVFTATGGNQAVNAPLQVYIGGKVANIGFQGRNGCCTSVDSIYVTVPDGVSGCAVSVLMQIGNNVSNATSIAVADTGRTCTPTNQYFPIGTTGTYSYGSLYLGRLVESTSKSDVAGGQFSKVTFSAPPTGSQLDINAPGSCSVTAYTGQVPPSSGSTTPLDAGPSIGLTGPNGLSKTLTKSSAAGFISYGAPLDLTATTLTAGSYTFTGSGGPDVGAFTASYSLPPIFTWTDQSTITMVNRASGVTVHWTGGNPSGYVMITGSSTSGTATALFSCTARISDLMFAVPSAVLLALPPSGSGILTVSASDYQPFPQLPSGLNAASVGSNFTYGSSVAYQ